MTSIAVTFSDTSLQGVVKQLANDLALPLATKQDDSFSYYLVLTPEYLLLQERGVASSGPIYVDFVGGALGHRIRFGGGRRQLIGRAVGISSKSNLKVLDVTAGLGRDALVLASLGCDVTMLESSSIVAALLRDGLKRLAQTEFFHSIKLNFIEMDSVLYLQQLSASAYPDVIYMDPMFPMRKKSAAVKKEMRLLRQVVGDNDNSTELLSLALRVAKKRVVIKRHRYSPAINNLKPDLVFNGKRNRFDVYTARQ